MSSSVEDKQETRRLVFEVPPRVADALDQYCADNAIPAKSVKRSSTRANLPLGFKPLPRSVAGIEALTHFLKGYLP